MNDRKNDKTEYFKPVRTAAFRKIGDEIVIVDTNKNRTMTLNRTGSEIWMRLEHHSLADITLQIAALFEVASLQAKKDVREFIVELLNKGLVEVDSER